MDMNKMLVAFNDTKNKAPYNALLLEMFNKLGGMEAGAVDLMIPELVKAGITIKRASLIGKLSIMGVKQIVKPKAKAAKKKDEGPTKKELVTSFLELLALTIDKADSLNNCRKGDMSNMIGAFKARIDFAEKQGVN